MTLQVRMGNYCSTNIPFNSPFSHHNSCCQASKSRKGAEGPAAPLCHPEDELRAPCAKIAHGCCASGAPSTAEGTEHTELGHSIILFPRQLYPGQRVTAVWGHSSTGCCGTSGCTWVVAEKSVSSHSNCCAYASKSTASMSKLIM